MIFGFLMLAFFALNWILSNWLWKPFYSTIEALSRYDVKQHQALQLPRSGTKEFDRLNGAVNTMTDKIRQDFLQQKEFTENASHEMQTPLAVIKTRLELLIQSKNLGEQEMDQLTAIEYAANKMSSLHKALLLLAKIENNQFKDLAEVDLKKIIEKVLMNYEDQLYAKSISVKTELKHVPSLRMNPVLADILVSNLIQNAIRHNEKGGAIEIDLHDNSLLVSNTGEPLQVPAEELFMRFKKNDASRESLGLGLAIVKSIAELYSIDLSYEWNEKRHSFRLIFSNR
jgi:signal transduction histidine kinase